MRDIVFRGKWAHTGEWVFGSLMIDSDGNRMIGRGGLVDVIAETVGQFTGLKDKRGKDIYEGDILDFIGGSATRLYKGYCQDDFLVGQKFVVTHLPTGFSLTDPKILGSKIPNQIGHVHSYEFWNHQNSFKIIGNIHDNPELL